MGGPPTALFHHSSSPSKIPDPERKESATEDQTSADSGQVRAGIASLDKDRNSLISVPVLVGASQVQSYQASHDDSVPCQLHGSCVSSIEFFITDQSGTKIDMQGSSFQATLRLFYPDPIHPQIGTADAEMDDAVGLRDVMFR